MLRQVQQISGMPGMLPAVQQARPTSTLCPLRTIEDSVPDNRGTDGRRQHAHGAAQRIRVRKKRENLCCL